MPITMHLDSIDLPMPPPPSRSDTRSPVGGLAFYLSLVAVALLAFSNCLVLRDLLPTAPPTALLIGTVATGAGWILSRLVVRDYLHVFLHEQKHAIVANLAGNRARGMRVRRQAGHFEYAYSKATAHLNAFIALAPYYLPLALIPLAVLAAVVTTDHHLRIALVCLGYGFDLRLQLIDISPAQTDLSAIRGGFLVGVLYVACVQLLVASTIVAWTIAAVPGLKALARGLFVLLHPNAIGG